MWLRSGRPPSSPQLLAAVDQDVARQLADSKDFAKVTRLMRQAEVAGLDRNA